MISNVIAFLAGSGVVAMLQVVLLPRLVGHLMSRGLERFKAELRSLGFQQETHFAWFYTERAKAIMGLYRRVADVRTATHLLAERASLGGDQSELQVDLLRRLERLFLHFNRSQIYLDADLRERLRYFMQSTDEARRTLRKASSVFDDSFRSWLGDDAKVTALLTDIERSFLESLSSRVPRADES
jgi:hypothetical protein